MLNYKTSIWEEESFLKKADVAIIGGGIVGINAAISAKEKNPTLDVLVIDRNTFPLGASTRNAGFACFGSVTELLDDLECTDEAKVFELLKRRIDGLNLLRNRVGDQAMQYIHTGSYEMFDKDEDQVDHYISKIPYLNKMIAQASGLKETFSVKSDSTFSFKGFHKQHIFNQHEGQLHPGKMMSRLYAIAQEKGVRFLMGHSISQIAEADEVSIASTNFHIKASKVIICTNGFTSKFLPEILITPARNQVFVTREIPGLDWSSCFHFDRGYVYFRNIGQRILIGGGRNIAKTAETTSDFSITDEIEDYLMRFLRENIGINPDNIIDYKWSGIMGVGEQKSPIIKKHSERIILAVRLGGMGVALGSLVGEEAAKILSY